MDQDDKLSASLTVLERRWEAMTGVARELREQIANQERQIADLEAQALQFQDRQASLEQEKATVIARIEGLLARFDELGSLEDA